MIKPILIKSGLCACLIFVIMQPVFGQRAFDQITWDSITTLPAAEGKIFQPGVAGAFAGNSNGYMLIAGGANFPDTMPWYGGIKQYYNDIFVYNWAAEKWMDKHLKLPYTVGYGASVMTEKGLLCIGGRNKDTIFKETFFLSYDVTTNSLQTRAFTPLPKPLFNMSAVLLRNIVYVAGGEDGIATQKIFFKIDIAAASPVWQELPVLPGLSISNAVLVAQANGLNTNIYLIGGKTIRGLQDEHFTSDIFRFDPAKELWITAKEVTDKAGKPVKISAGTGFAVGSNYILLAGGNTSNLLDTIIGLNKLITNTSSALEKENLKKRLNIFLNNHPGFHKNIYLYNTITDIWTQISDFPYQLPVTLNAFKMGDDIILPGGEVKPGVRTTGIIRGSIQARSYFTIVDYIVLSIYFLLMLGIGYWAAKRQKSTDDYFRASERIPAWAAGLSIFGTQLSAITFMAVPAKTYGTDWSYFFLQMSILIAFPFIARFFIPFYKNLNVTSAYEYLEKRFNYAVRLTGSLLFILLQTARIAIVLLLPSLALTIVTGIPVETCILLMGGITILYTFKGGIEAVIWTDVVQVIILLGGAMLCLFLIPMKLDFSSQEMVQRLVAYNKLKIADFSLDFTQPTIWVMLLGGMAINIVTYGSDQSIVQRYMTTKSTKDARKGLRLSALMTIPSTFIFFGIGTMLFLFYSNFPLEVNMQLQSQDAIFPWFIVSQLPAGIIGLLIAAIFAAAMSTLSSSLNSIATAIITDIYKPWTKPKTDKHFLSIAQIITVIIGLLGSTLALWMANQGITSLWDQFNMLLGLFIGSLGGVFLLGIFTTKANGYGAFIGIICSAILQYILKIYTPLNFLMFAFTGAASCMILGYLASFLFADKTKNIEGLTIYSLKKEAL